MPFSARIFLLAALTAPTDAFLLGVRPIVPSRARAAVAESKDACNECVRIDNSTVKNVAEAAYSDAACAVASGSRAL